jgi:hypothetical protein
MNQLIFQWQWLSCAINRKFCPSMACLHYNKEALSGQEILNEVKYKCISKTSHHGYQPELTKHCHSVLGPEISAGRLLPSMVA